MSRIVFAVSAYLGASTCYRHYLSEKFVHEKEDEIMVPHWKQSKPVEQKLSTAVTYKYAPVVKPEQLHADAARVH